MERITQLFRRAAYLWRARRHAADLAEEMEQHRAQLQARLETDGLPAADAEARSRRAMGNVTLAREEARDVWIVGFIDRVWRDVKYGVRGLRREPLFAATACVTLAAGMAVATTVFSVVDAELWKPLPFPHPEELVAVSPRAPGPQGSFERIAGADFLDWQTQSHAFAALAATGNRQRAVLQRDGAESVLLTPVTPNYFDVLRESALIGRLISEADGQGEPAGVVSERAWRRLFDSDPGAVGRTVTIENRPVVIVGIRSSEREFAADPTDVFVAIDGRSADFLDRSRRTFEVIGRLRPGVTATAAQSEMNAIAGRIAQLYPAGRLGRQVYVEDLKRSYMGFNWRPLYFFLYAAGLVMILTCVNVAGLVLARALRRGREFALRGALGGGRRALIRQLLVEGALLAIPGGTVGLLLTTWSLGVLSRFMPPDFLERGAPIPVDARVCLAAFGLAAMTAIVFGLVPALFARRVDLSLTLGQGGRTTGRSPGQARARHLLMGAQIALTVVLVVTAGLFVRSFDGLTRIPVGFDPSDGVSLRVSLTGPRYETGAQVHGYVSAVLERARAIPGVREAAITTSGPLGSGPVVFFFVPGRPRPAPGLEPKAIIRSVTPEYFRTVGIRLIAGRAFTDADADGAPRVAIVNQTLASRLFPGEPAVGQVIELLPDARAPWTRHPGRLTIVGVSGNIKEVGLNEVAFNGMYVPFAQMPSPAFEVTARAAVPAASIAAALRASAAGVDPNVPLSRVTTLDERIEEALRGDRFNLLAIAIFAAAALLLAGIGIFGLLAYAVQERRREFGVRIALGASRSAIVAAALGESLRVAAGGIAAGLAATFILARLIGSALYLVPGAHNGLLYGVTTTDPLALSAAVLVLAGVALLASVVPAHQATQTDPLVALRAD